MTLTMYWNGMFNAFFGLCINLYTAFGQIPTHESLIRSEDHNRTIDLFTFSCGGNRDQQQRCVPFDVVCNPL